MKTAYEYVEEFNSLDGAYADLRISDLLIVFAQDHVENALKEAAKKAEVCIKFNDRDNSELITDEHGLRDQDGIWCEISVHTQSILDSFKPENIK